ncbi:glycosyltransferase family 2 protein [Parasediminibacterium sp. JCM 36343]|uniref:glycosyltransferase family 2 protein n=1 Tax=Parasediminibacterium sp. JCM 36343 TaxID=3374279 RepID=UPI003977E4A2
MKKNVSIVIPVYNEAKNIANILRAINNVLQPMQAKYSFTVTFIDDGSRDGTLQVIKEQAAKNQHIFFVSFSKNFGHQNALKAGFDVSNADCVITMDGDLQHPPELLAPMLEQWETGSDVVFTVRQDQKELSYFKRKSSMWFYNVLNSLSDIEIESGTADFRLMDKRVVDILKTFEEVDLFWRGLVKWLGFKQSSIEYMPAERTEGQSKYTYKKMVQFALKGITSFSTKPLSIAIYVGFTFSLLSLLYVPYVLYSLWRGNNLSGWASIIVTIAFFGGLQLTILGIIGMYLGKLFIQSKNRPHYIINETNIK